MAIPTLLLTPGESRGRAGVIETEVSGIVDVAADAWHLWKGLGDPALLLSPDESRDANGPVIPVINGAVSVVDGQYGKAWRADSASARVTVSALAYLNTASIAILMRYRAVDVTSYIMAAGASIAQEFIGFVNYNGVTGVRGTQTGGSVQTPQLTASRAEVGGFGPTVAALRSTAGGRDMWVANVHKTAAAGPMPTFSDTHRLGFGNGLAAIGTELESSVVYNTGISDADILRILQMPRRWEWGPDGTVTAPHPEPLGSVLVRYRAAGVIHTAHLDGPGTFGTHGTVSHDGDTITIGTTRDIEVMGVVAWPTELDSPDAAKFSAMETWAWPYLLPKIGGILRMSSPEPLVISRSTSPEPIVISRTHQEL